MVVTDHIQLPQRPAPDFHLFVRALFAAHRGSRGGSKNAFAFMEQQDVRELSNFFERRVSAYQVGVSVSVSFDADF
ncbi:hypothetical protein ACFOY2_51080 [Nonomuraea purpurea]|uniref:Uncharacterized protein n=1 Tax=Nonomuraea purpurea TaxID=1849276 RepID=A0ABV8GNU2_9ACTN